MAWFFSVEKSYEELTTIILDRSMNLEDGLEQVNHHLGFFQIGWGVLLPFEEVAFDARLIVEDSAAQLE